MHFFSAVSPGSEVEGLIELLTLATLAMQFSN